MWIWIFACNWSHRSSKRIFIGGVKATAAGIAAAVIFGFFASLVAKPDLK